MEILLKYLSHTVVLWARSICPIKILKRTTVIKNQLVESQEIEDFGSGAHRRQADTTRLINFDAHTWRKFTKAQCEEMIRHVASQAASLSSGQLIELIQLQ